MLTIDPEDDMGDEHITSTTTANNSTPSANNTNTAATSNDNDVDVNYHEDGDHIVCTPLITYTSLSFLSLSLFLFFLLYSILSIIFSVICIKIIDNLFLSNYRVP